MSCATIHALEMEEKGREKREMKGWGEKMTL